MQKAFHFWRSTSNTAISAMAYSLCGGYGADDLWQIDDGIRDKERSKDFGEGFIRLARSVS